MKKIVVFLFLLIPFHVFAYSDTIIPGGETLGIDVNTDGIMVVGFYKVDKQYINKYLSLGDKIKTVDNKEVYSVTELVNVLEEAENKESIQITYEHDGKLYDNEFVLKKDGDNYKTGLYVKGNIVGIGTLTFVDPETMVYGILGHVINESKTGSKVDIRDGFSYLSNVTSFTRSVDGSPGSKNAVIDDKKFGTIVKNTDFGVYGRVFEIPKKNELPVAELKDVHLGHAMIYTTNINDEIKEYSIDILNIDFKSKTKNIYFEITDEELLEMSGGIVQGMSGSPIIQDEKIVGAVTRVVVDNVKRGYGISIVTMLEEGDKISQNKND